MASPALAPPQVVDVTLSLFGGRKTDITPSDCPEGVTPDEQDGIYLPGGWFSRPGLSKLFPNQLSNGASVLYEKTYVQPDNDPLTLILTSDGKLWAEDVLEAPLVPAQIGSVPAGLYAQSVSAFGREYIAVSDLLQGQGVPLQYDGTNLDRVTQDGPGAAPSIGDENVSVAVTASPGGLLNVTSLVATITESGFLVTVTINPIPFAFQQPGVVRQGDAIKVSGVATAGYNGTFLVSSFVVNGAVATLTYVNGVTGLAPDNTGTIAYSLASVLPAANNDAIIRATPTQILIAGAGVAGYNGTWVYRGNALSIPACKFYVYIPNAFNLAASGNGTSSSAGSASIGTHQAVLIFLTRNGALTAPSPPVPWNTAGGLRALVANLAIGPSNVVARLLAFTAAGGDNFFTLPSPATIPQPTGPAIIIPALIVPDNTSTSAVVDFSDNALLAGIAIDQIGNDLFDQRVLGPVLGFFAYASRLVCWGDYAKIENLLNMGFCGGYLLGTLTIPLGWTVVTAGGILVNGGSWAAGMCWQITGDGSNNPRGQLSQPAYQDAFGTPILLPITSYLLRMWVQSPSGAAGGFFYVDLYSPTAGVLATAQIPVAAASAAGNFAQANFSAKTPAVIPSDTVVRVYEKSVSNAILVNLSEVELVYAQNPYNNSLAHVSYVLNPEGFAQTTGNLGPSDDPSPIRCFTRQRDTALLKTAEGRHVFQDNNYEPDKWVINQISQASGAVSLRAGDSGKFGTGDGAVDWDATAAKEGVYLFAGADFWKISQEISRGVLPQSQDPRITWNDINWAAEHTIVLKNDVENRRILVAAPVNGATVPSHIFVLDYRELDTAVQIATAAPVHITLAGKMKSSDLTRKWSVWNVAANDLEVLVRPGNQRQLFFAGGPRNGTAYGNLYSLDPAKLTDDDYGRFYPYYTTYAFTDHDTEQALGIGSDLHLVKHIHAFIAGVGIVYITPIVNSLYNFQPNLSLRILVSDTNAGNFLKSDLEWSGLTIHGNRIFFRISVQPLPGATDVQIRLQKFVVGMMRDPMAAFRQSGV